jgi:hypothetical protein
MKIMRGMAFWYCAGKFATRRPDQAGVMYSGETLKINSRKTDI